MFGVVLKKYYPKLVMFNDKAVVKENLKWKVEKFSLPDAELNSKAANLNPKLG